VGDPPPGRYRHGFVANAGKFYVFGGIGGPGVSNFLPGLFVFDPVELSWNDISNKTSGIAPSLRCDFGFASAAGKLFVHGGYNPLAGGLDDLFSFDPVTMSWAKISETARGPSPQSRQSHGFTSCEGLLYLFGGKNGQGHKSSRVPRNYLFFDSTR
jgi:N-acetylneuraminic acid mutarotase